MNKKDKDSRVQQAGFTQPPLDVIDEKKFSGEKSECEKEYKNICSWLLIFSPEELVVISDILAILITKNLTLEEQAVVGAFLTDVAGNIFLISAQSALIQTAVEEQKEICDKQKERIRKEKEKIQKLIEEREKEQTQKEIKELKEQVKELQDLLNKQLRL